MESITAQIHLGTALTAREMRIIREHAERNDLSFDAAAVQFLKRGIRHYLAAKKQEVSAS